MAKVTRFANSEKVKKVRKIRKFTKLFVFDEEKTKHAIKYDFFLSIILINLSSVFQENVVFFMFCVTLSFGCICEMANGQLE